MNPNLANQPSSPLISIKAVWAYRYYILAAIKNNLAARFARSRIGAVWMIINPLVQVSIYALILSALVSSKLPNIDNRFSYAIYLTAGVLAWSLFADVINRCLILFIDNGKLMKKVPFPRMTLPIIATGAAIVNNLLLLLAIIVIFLFLGHIPSLTILWLPLLMLISLMLAVGIGLIVGVLNVFLRDVGETVPLLLQIGFWLTPIVYPLHIVPDSIKGIMALNPMYTIVTSYQAILVYGKAPNLTALSAVTAFSLMLLLFGLFLYRKAASELVDAL